MSSTTSGVAVAAYKTTRQGFTPTPSASQPSTFEATMTRMCFRCSRSSSVRKSLSHAGTNWRKAVKK
eukprot:3456825-Alexandrium_andersonii.AAC.1